MPPNSDPICANCFIIKPTNDGHFYCKNCRDNQNKDLDYCDKCGLKFNKCMLCNEPLFYCKLCTYYLDDICDECIDERHYL